MKNIILRSRASILLALIVVILPFLSLPEIVQDSLFVILGLLIALLGFAKSHYVSNLDTESENFENPATEVLDEDFSTQLENKKADYIDSENNRTVGNE